MDLRFVCTQHNRSTAAPENLLLAATLYGMLCGTGTAAARLSHRGLFGPDDRRLLSRTRALALQALESPLLRPALAEVRARGLGGEVRRRELTRQVRQRVECHPPAAPSWARDLLEGLSQPVPGPPSPELLRADTAQLWRILARLDSLMVLRSVWPLVEQPRGTGFRWQSHRLELNSQQNTWMLYGADVDTVAIRIDGSMDIAEVQHRVAWASWFGDDHHDGRLIRRWLTFHRCRSEPGIAIIARGVFELCMVRLDVDRGMSDDDTSKLLRWLVADRSGSS